MLVLNPALQARHTKLLGCALATLGAIRFAFCGAIGPPSVEIVLKLGLLLTYQISFN